MSHASGITKTNVQLFRPTRPARTPREVLSLTRHPSQAILRIIAPHRSRDSGIGEVFYQVGLTRGIQLNVVESSASGFASGPESVAVLIDYENTRRNARDAFLERSAPSFHGMVDPVTVAQKIVEQRNRQRLSKLEAVKVFRGRPNPEHQPESAGAFDRFASAWTSDPIVELRPRDLKYRFLSDGTFEAREKGVDVDLAVQAIKSALLDEFDVLIIFSNDSDLVPAIELVYSETRTRVEVAAWSAEGMFALNLNSGRGSKRRPFCHYLDKGVFERCRVDE